MFDSDEVLPMDNLIHPIFIREGYNFTRKIRRTRRASRSNVAEGFDGEDLRFSKHVRTI